jgi:hypothetical protein
MLAGKLSSAQWRQKQTVSASRKPFEMEITNKEITVSKKIISIDGAPDCFALEIHSLEHMDSWSLTPQDINTEADAYANDDREDQRYEAIINYDCIAWKS